MKPYQPRFPRPVPALNGGFTLVETLISVALFSFLSAIIVGGSISFARAARATNTQQRMAEQARVFTERLNFEIAEQASVTAPIVVSPDGLTLTVAQTRQGAMPQQIRIIYNYEDPELVSDPLQLNIRNKRITRTVTVDGVTVSPLQTALALCSRVPVDPVDTPEGAKIPVFAQDARSAIPDPGRRPVFNVVVRTGDKANPPDPRDNAVTGPGYQGMLVQTSLATPPIF